MAYPLAASPRYAIVSLDAGDTIVQLGTPDPFPVIEAEDLIVTRIREDEDGDPVRTLLVLDVDYSVSLLDQLPGARITLAEEAEQDDELEIVGQRPIARATDLTDGQKFSDATLNREFDDIKIVEQELRRDVDRSFKWAVGVTGLTVSEELAEGDTLMRGPANTLVAGPSAADIQDVQPNAAAAAEARDFAAQWASDPEDGPPIDDGVNPPGQSAFHWAEKANDHADRADTAADLLENPDFGFITDIPDEFQDLGSIV
jgi:hypothetical protein